MSHLPYLVLHGHSQWGVWCLMRSLMSTGSARAVCSHPVSLLNQHSLRIDSNGVSSDRLCVHEWVVAMCYSTLWYVAPEWAVASCTTELTHQKCFILCCCICCTLCCCLYGAVYMVLSIWCCLCCILCYCLCCILCCCLCCLFCCCICAAVYVVYSAEMLHNLLCIMSSCC